MKPLIKYPGGKYKEYDKIKIFFPDKIENYYEPFFGGGGVFFRLLDDKKILGRSGINDFSRSLMEFYMSVPRVTFEIELLKLSNAWDVVRGIGEKVFLKFYDRFNSLLLSKEDISFVDDTVSDFIDEQLKDFNLNTHGFSIKDRINSSLNDKLKKFKSVKFYDDKKNVVNKCITTSICQAFYFVIRDMYNDWNNGENMVSYTMEERSAQWMFIREFCFGSMFRFGHNGDFNVPYGGFSYNNKCFPCKIENITSEKVRKVFSEVDIKCCDFEEAINTWKYEKDDFMFLDPPYDSTFSEYDNNSFGKNEHIRLANCLKKCKCKWLIAIGKTDFIHDLYKDYDIVEYDKTYMYQARGKYDNKHTTHLVITNYSLSVH